MDKLQSQHVENLYDNNHNTNNRKEWKYQRCNRKP